MYMCQPGLLMRLICWAICLAILPEIGFCLWLLLASGYDVRLLVYAGIGVVLFCGLEVALVRRLVFLGPAWLEYDDTRLIWHFDRREELALRWEDLAGVTVYEEGRNLIFSHAEKKRRLVITPMFEGWRDLREELQHRGLLPADFDPEQLLDSLFGPVDRNDPGFHSFKWDK